MRRVAWLTNKDVKGGTGGAESADRDMLRKRPEGVEVTLVHTGGVIGQLDNFDFVIAAGLYGFSSRELNHLAENVSYSYWVHDTQLTGHWIYEDAKHLIFLTPGHRDFELKNNPRIQRPEIHLNPGYMDTSLCMTRAKEPYALWAHPAYPHKGLDLATEWAEDKGIELRVLTGVSRRSVIESMQTAQYFVLLSHIFDAGPRSIIEAQLCGCEIVINENVGIWDEPWGDLEARITRAPDEFWNLVLS